MPIPGSPARLSRRRALMLILSLERLIPARHSSSPFPTRSLRQRLEMKQIRLLMGMPITVEVVDPVVTQDDLERVFAYFTAVDNIFSTYKETSEISRLNRGELA